MGLGGPSAFGATSGFGVPSGNNWPTTAYTTIPQSNYPNPPGNAPPPTNYRNLSGAMSVPNISNVSNQGQKKMKFCHHCKMVGHLTKECNRRNKNQQNQ